MLHRKSTNIPCKFRLSALKIAACPFPTLSKKRKNLLTIGINVINFTARHMLCRPVKKKQKKKHKKHWQINYKQIFSCQQRNFRHFCAFFKSFLTQFLSVNFLQREEATKATGALFRVTQKHISLIISSFITTKC